MSFDILALVETAAQIPDPEKDLFVDHPLKDSPLEEKITYLQALSLAMTADDELHAKEEKYLTMLILSLELDKSVLSEIIEFAKAPDAQTIKDFLFAYKEKDLVPLFLFEALMMVHRDGQIKEAEQKLLDTLALQLGVSKTIEQAVTQVFDHIQAKQWAQALMPFHLGLLDLSYFKHIFAFYDADIEDVTAKQVVTVGDTEFTMTAIPAGEFEMGSNDYDSRKPVHNVTVPAFAMMEAQVTFDLWDEYLKDNSDGYNPEAKFGRVQQPVINVSWEDITETFIPWLNEKTGNSFRLPSESEWEYACRAGTTSKFSTGDTIDALQANIKEANLGKTTPVKSYPANPWGLFDMHGNVCEWCQDHWADGYKHAPSDGSAQTAPNDGGRVNRGGYYNDYANRCRSDVRSYYGFSSRVYYIGFRLVQGG